MFIFINQKMTHQFFYCSHPKVIRNVNKVIEMAMLKICIVNSNNLIRFTFLYCTSISKFVLCASACLSSIRHPKQV